MEEILEKVKEFADKAHGEQQRKYAPERYIAHPIRVMEICKQYISSLPVLAAALLHDVLEDTDIDKHQMNEFLLSVMNKEDTTRTLELVVELTDIYTKANYPRLRRRKRKEKEAERLAKTSHEAQTIKYADIMDNSKEIGGQDSDFAPVFLRECKMLLEKMTKGDPELYQKARQVVEEELRLVERAS